MSAAFTPNLDPGYKLKDGDSHYLNISSSLKSWLFTLDHKRIGLMYLGSILLFFLVGGVFALLIRTELASRGATILGSDDGNVWMDVYNQVFTIHGAVMVFLFIIPSIPAALGNFVLPLMLGAKDVAFPRLNLLSLWVYWVGSIFFLLVLAGVFQGYTLDTGWTFYTPYSTSTAGDQAAMDTVILATAGAFILGFSSILTGVNFIASIHMLRPPGMTWFRMPLFLWALYATAVIQVLATPVLAITLLLLIAERFFQVGIFDPAYGGDPILFQHFFWFYSHPAVYIMILPAMGIMSEIVSVFSRKHIFGYRFIAFSSLAIALFGFLVWGHHMFTSGQSVLANAVFSLLTYSVSIPSAIKVFNWMGTMWKGSLDLRTPMWYAISFLLLFTIGGLTGLYLGALATDIHFHDTYFIVAHFHYVMMGGTAILFFGGIYYWWPKMTGRMYSEKGGFVGALLIFLGFNLTFFPQFILGYLGMPRRYAEIPAGDGAVHFLLLHQMSTVGSFLLAVGIGVALLVLLVSLFNGKRASANPWGAATLEWRTTSPPPMENFHDIPVVGDPYDLTGLKWNPNTGEYERRAKSPVEQPEPVSV